MGELQSPFIGGVVKDAVVLQDTPDTLAILAEMPAGLVKISFFGNIGFGRVDAPLLTRDGVLLVASLQDLMATKLKRSFSRDDFVSKAPSLYAVQGNFSHCKIHRFRCISLNYSMQIWIKVSTSQFFQSGPRSLHSFDH